MRIRQEPYTILSPFTVCGFRKCRGLLHTGIRCGITVFLYRNKRLLSVCRGRSKRRMYRSRSEKSITKAGSAVRTGCGRKVLASKDSDSLEVEVVTVEESQLAQTDLSCGRFYLSLWRYHKRRESLSKSAGSLGCGCKQCFAAKSSVHDRCIQRSMGKVCRLSGRLYGTE